MDIILATQNLGKISEFQRLLEPHDLITKDIDVDETGLSFHENALLKARACATKDHGCYIGDDSGIMIDALSGMPGIYSKRWRDAQSVSDAIAHVLEDLEEYPDQQPAQMICCIAYITHVDDPLPRFFMGIQEGLFCKTPKGDHGFAYDPYFYLPELKKTNAELSPQIKNQVSHRALATRKLLTYIHSNTA